MRNIFLILLFASFSFSAFSQTTGGTYLVVREADYTVSNTYTAYVSGISAYGGSSYKNSIRLRFIQGNTGSSTININNIGTVTLQKLVTGSLVNLSSGDIVANSFYDITYNGSVFIIDLRTIGDSEVSSVFGRDGDVVATSGDYTGAQITNTPNGDITSVTVQTALNELDTDKQPLDADLTTIAGLTPSANDALQFIGSAWANRTMTQFKTSLSLTKSDVGLGSVDNTTDLSKPVSTATQTALDLKSNRAYPSIDVTTSFVTSLVDAGVSHYNITPSGTVTITFPSMTGLEGVQFAFWKNVDADMVQLDFGAEPYNGATVIPDTTWVYANYSDGRWKVAGTNPATGGSGIESVVAGNLIDIDATDPANPIVAVETGDKGDVTIGGNTLTIDNNTVTFAKMQTIIDNTLLGANGGTAVEQISISSPMTLSSNTLGIQIANTSQSGSLTSTDWNIFNGKYGPGGTDVAIADGGTNASTATAGFNNLSPTTTTGDMIYDNGTTDARLAIGTADYVLTASGGIPSWQPDQAIGTQDLFISAAAMWPRTTGGCAALAQTELSTSIFNIQSLDFDQSTDEFAQFQISLPRKWNNGTVTVVFYWTASTGSGNVVWTVNGGAYSDDDALTVAFGTAQSVTDGLTATNDLMISSATSAVTIAGTPVDADFLAFQISRDADNGSDTFSADAKLLGISIRITTDAAKDN